MTALRIGPSQSQHDHTMRTTTMLIITLCLAVSVAMGEFRKATSYPPCLLWTGQAVIARWLRQASVEVIAHCGSSVAAFD